MEAEVLVGLGTLITGLMYAILSQTNKRVTANSDDIKELSNRMDSLSNRFSIIERYFDHFMAVGNRLIDKVRRDDKAR